MRSPPTGQQSLPIVSKTIGLLYREPKGSHLSAPGPDHFLAISPRSSALLQADFLCFRPQWRLLGVVPHSRLSRLQYRAWDYSLGPTKALTYLSQVGTTHKGQ